MPKQDSFSSIRTSSPPQRPNAGGRACIPLGGVGNAACRMTCVIAAHTLIFALACLGTGKSLTETTLGGARLTVELRVVMWSVVLGFVHIIASSHAASSQRSYRWTASARDEPVQPLTGVAGRLERALKNFLETFPLFVALVFVAQLSGIHNQLTEWGSFLYLAARVAYLPLYAFGVFLVRSLVWNVAALGMLLFVIAILRV